MASLISIFVWFAISIVAQGLLYPIFEKMIPSRVTAYGVSKVLSFWIVTYVVWVLALLTGADVFSLAVIVFAGLAVIFIKNKWHESFESLLPAWEDIRTTELLYFGTLICIWLQTTFHPEIYWGEKPMDFTFLNYFTRLSTLPPTDPWAVGNSMGYYYLGALYFALLHKLSGLSPAIGYNLSIAIVGAQIVIVWFSLFQRFITKKLAVCGALLLPFLATYDTWFVLFTGFKPLGFDLYWATSRTLGSPGINEYPLWSLLFGDLHAHVIAQPLVGLCVLFFSLIAESIFSDSYLASKKINSVGILASFVWGLLVATNSWDYITLGLLLGVGFALLLIAVPALWKRISELGISVLIGSIIVSLPFHISVHTKTTIGWGYVYPEEFNTFLQLFRIHGQFLLMLCISFIALAKATKSDLFARNTPWQFAKILFCTCVPFMIGVGTAYARSSNEIPLGPLVFSSLIALPASYFLFAAQFNKSVLRISGLLLFLAALLLSLAECFFFMDRMNTLFKSYNVIWGVLASGTFLAVFEAVRSPFAKAVKISVATALLPAVIASLVLVGIMCTFNRINTHRPTFDGTAYLKEFNPTEKFAFDWLNTHVKGTPAMLEAFGPSYQEFTRFAMHTGLPVVLGWEYHVQQRGTRDSEQRKADILTIYESEDIHATMRALNKYRVSIIAVGRRERDQYGSLVEEKFSNNPAYFKRIFQIGAGRDSISLYTHRYAKSL